MAQPLSVRDQGITVLSTGGDSAIVDIVFIHGLQGHPRETWRYKHSTVPADPDLKFRGRSKKLRRIFHRNHNESADAGKGNLTPESCEGSDEGIFWPLDLLPRDCPNARILTFGYDSHVSHFFGGPASQSNISAHGRSLLHALEVYRRKCPKRPILFVVHSLGGIILKETLRRSRTASLPDNADLRNIYHSTHAIVFFGTPHRGSSYAQLGLVAGHIAKLSGFDTNSELLRNLKPDGSHLEILREEFGTMLNEHSFKITSFQEGKGFKGVNLLSAKIVDDASSALDDPSVERKDFINANHMMMCRFTGKEDDGYVKSIGVIMKYMEEIREVRKQEELEIDALGKKLRKDILESLRTTTMKDREHQIEQAHSHTYEWVFTSEKSGFRKWMEGDDSIFWIKGKPGSGKSTLMKYIVKDPRTQQAFSSRNRNVLSTPAFFFHDRGVHDTQKSFEGLLRSIIYQLLDDIPGLTHVVEAIYLQQLEHYGLCSWSVAELERTLQAIIHQQTVSGCVCLFIDALDEYKGEKDWITRFLKSLAEPPTADQKLTVRVCASSREWTVFGLLLGDFAHLTLQDFTKGDIERFAQDRLTEAKRDDSRELLDEIVKRADGVFLWVKLVIGELLEPLFDGEPIRGLVERLSELPDELPGFYQRMLSNVLERNHMVAVSLFELVLAAECHRISISEICLALDLTLPGAKLPDELNLDTEADRKRITALQRRVKAYSGGLLEMPSDARYYSGSGNADGLDDVWGPDEYVGRPSVQFIHQTAKTFVENTKDRAWFGGKSAVDLAQSGLERLARLHIQLIKHMDVTPGSDLFAGFSNGPPPKCPDGFPHFDPKVVFAFLHVTWAIENLPRRPNSAIVAEFREDMAHYCGPTWMETLWSGKIRRYMTLSMADVCMGVLKPTSFLDFAAQYRMPLVAYHEAEENLGQYDGCMYGPRLLYYAIICNATEGRAVRAAQWEDIAGLFLRLGFDPNGPLVVPVEGDRGILMQLEEYDESKPMGGLIATHYFGEGAERDAEGNIVGDAEGDADATTITITPLDLALAVALSSVEGMIIGRTVDRKKEEILVSRINMLRILVEGGGDVSRSFRNHWARTGKVERERSAVHYLLSKSLVRYVFPDPGLARAFHKCVASFFDHGLDPNGVDSEGRSILECAFDLPTPDWFIETLLERKAKITPKLLSDTGQPIAEARMLDSARWRKPQYYTPEAQEIARKYNPDWPQEEEVVGGPQKTKSIFQLATSMLDRWL